MPSEKLWLDRLCLVLVVCLVGAGAAHVALLIMGAR